MRISHGQLEACRANPSAWLAGGGGRGSFSYSSAVKLAAFGFHKTGSRVAAMRQLEGYLRKNFKVAERKEWARDTLGRYLDWCESARPIVADTGARLSLDLGSDVLMSGEMSRVDIDPKTESYRAVLLVIAEPANWVSELRWPLIQLAVAQKYSRDIAAISVGIQRLDGAGLDTRRFSSTRIDKHLSEARDLAHELRNATVV